MRRKWTRAAAVSAVAVARRGRNRGLLTLVNLGAVSVKGQRAIDSAHSRESACEEIAVAGAMLVIAPSPLAGEGNSMLPQTNDG